MRWFWSSPPADIKEDSNVVAREKQALEMDLEQVKSVNLHVLMKAISRNWIDTEQAEVIKSIQVDGPYSECT